MHKRFPSIEQPEKFGYAYDTDSWSSDAPVYTNFRQFQTYGDGLIQHSSDWPITIEFLPDYLASLTAAILAEPLDAEDALASRIPYVLERGPNVETIAFAASVVFKQDPSIEPSRYSAEKKRRYFSVELRKVTTSQDKVHDKRYQEVAPWCDGTPEAIYRMLVGDFPSALRAYAVARAIREWVRSQPNGYLEQPALFLKWREYKGDHDKAYHLEYTWEAALAACEAYRLHHQAQETVARIKRRVEREKAQKAEAETAA